MFRLTFITQLYIYIYIYIYINESQFPLVTTSRVHGWADFDQTF